MLCCCIVSASTDGRVFVRHIVESRAADGKHLIQEHIVAAIQFIGNWEATNPRICWQKQVISLEILGPVKDVVECIDYQTCESMFPRSISHAGWHSCSEMCHGTKSCMFAYYWLSSYVSTHF